MIISLYPKAFIYTTALFLVLLIMMGIFSLVRDDYFNPIVDDVKENMKGQDNIDSITKYQDYFFMKNSFVENLINWVSLYIMIEFFIFSCLKAQTIKTPPLVKIFADRLFLFIFVFWLIAFFFNNVILFVRDEIIIYVFQIEIENFPVINFFFEYTAVICLFQLAIMVIINSFKEHLVGLFSYLK